MSIKVYGITNCDTVKKARSWLEAHRVDYAFHDYKKAGADSVKLGAWCDKLGWETVLNRAGTTFKKLAPAEKEGLDRGKAIALMARQPSMIKRPIVEHPAGLLVGFKPGEWEAALGK